MKPKGIIIIKCFLLLSVFLLAQNAAFAQEDRGPSPTPTKPNPVTAPLNNSPRFQPSVLTTELQRAAITGNPSRRPLNVPLPSPILLQRPDKIPPTYPAGRNDGVRFIQP